MARRLQQESGFGHPWTLAKIYAPEPFAGTAANRRTLEAVRNLTLGALARHIGGPNDAYCLDLYSIYSYYSGPKALSLNRDTPAAPGHRMVATCLTQAVALGVPGTAGLAW